MGAVAADVPEFYKLQYQIPDIASQLRYIAKLYHNEIHVIAKTSIKSLADLNGKKCRRTDRRRIVFGQSHFLSPQYQGELRFSDGRRHRHPEDRRWRGRRLHHQHRKVFPLARAIKNENRALHLVSVPYDRRLQDLYLPTTLSGDEYPNLLAPGETIDTVATSVLLVSYNWPENTERYNRSPASWMRSFPNSTSFRSRHAIRNGRKPTSA
jgi:hypothetical protein